jgi:hypothetical protein
MLVRATKAPFRRRTVYERRNHMSTDKKPVLTKYGDFYKIRVDIDVESDGTAPIYREMFDLFNASMEVRPDVEIRVFSREREEDFAYDTTVTGTKQEVFYVNVKVPPLLDALQEVTRIIGLVFYAFQHNHSDKVVAVKCRTVMLEPMTMQERYSSVFEYDYRPSTFLKK